MLDVEVARLGADIEFAALAPVLAYSGELGARWFDTTVASTAADHRPGTTRC